MTIIELKKYFVNKLSEVNSDQVEVENFFYSISEYLHDLKRIDIILNPSFVISDNDYLKWSGFIEELKTEKPIQYILEEAWFYGLKFQVNKNTLIPRPETEELVEWIIDSLKKKEQLDAINILDIGTGSGCIPVSLKHEMPIANVYAIDVSIDALQVACKNAQYNTTTVNFIEQNILEVSNLNFLDCNFDIIVSNPPYVRNLEKQEIKNNVLNYEPHLALFVEDDDALIFYKKIAELAKNSLKSDGFLFFEINQYLGNETLNLLKNLGYKDIQLRKDLLGNDRMIRCRF